MLRLKNLNPIFITGVYLFIYFAILVLCSTFLVRRIQEVNQSVVDRFVSITNTHSVSQTIRSQNNGLNVIVIYLKNAQIKNRDPFIFTLQDGNKNTIRNIQISGANIGDGETVRFQFDPISDSSNQQYLIKLESPNTTIDNPHIEAGFSNQDTYPKGSSLDLNTPGDLSFQLYYRPTSKQIVLKNLSESILSKVNIKLAVSIIFSVLVCSSVMKLVK